MTPHTEILAGLGALRVLGRLHFVTNGPLLQQVHALEEALLDQLEKLELLERDTLNRALRGGREPESGN